MKMDKKQNKQKTKKNYIPEFAESICFIDFSAQHDRVFN